MQTALCNSRSAGQLRAQLSYLTTKSSFIFDSRGTHDGKNVLSPGEIERVVRRFESQWNERYAPKLGHTSHLLMAFPIGTRTTEVREITREICERFFEGDGARFDYIAAIHESRAHPHAHIVLNRRSKDGEMFFLGKNHHFNYNVFREAMVEAAERHGLRLEATRRLDRGVPARAPSDVEIRKAEAEGRVAAERLRNCTDLDRALAEVARNAAIYRDLAAEASRANFHDVAEALTRAGDLLARGETIQSDGVLYMSEDRPYPQHNNESSLIMISGHLGIYTSLTDVTAPNGARAVVEVDPSADVCARGGAGLEGIQIDALILQRSL